MSAEVSDVVEYVSVERLRENENNPRVHPERQIEALARSMREFGFGQPLVTDENYVVIAGHGRLSAVRLVYANGGVIPNVPPGTVPVVVARGFTEREKTAYVVADNRLGSLSVFDAVTLAAELKELSDEGVPAEALGFTLNDISRVNDDAARASLDALAGTDTDIEESFSEERVANPVTADGSVAFQVMVPAVDRQLVYDAIALAKRRFSLVTTGEALFALVCLIDSRV